MNLSGVEVPFQTSFTIEHNTILVVISDEKGAIRLVKIDKNSIPENEAFLRVPTTNLQAPTNLNLVANLTLVTNDSQQLYPRLDAKAQSGCYVRLGDRVQWKDPCPPGN